jgi:4-amino-4-deoxy-L-arabinose transferase-like glycosyltransferase
MTRIGAAVLLGVILRLALSWAAADTSPIADMSQYHFLGTYLHQHGAFYPDAPRGPGYPTVLAAAFAALGESNWAARVANSVIGGMLILATGFLARAMGSGERAWNASAVVAVYPGLLMSTLYQMPDTLYALLVVTSLLALYGQTDRQTDRQTDGQLFAPSHWVLRWAQHFSPAQSGWP